MKRAANSAAEVSADAEYFTPWCSSKRDFSPRKIWMVCSTVGSFTSIFWKRRDSAWSFSNTPRYSVKVVAPIHFNWPLESAGFKRLDASNVPPDAEPAPMMVWISSMNKIPLGLFFICFNTAFKRCSKSPRYLVPANKAPMSSEYTTAFCKISGTSPWVTRHARPSAIAVLPTPASPTNKGLFLRRRHKVWITRSTSASRPINGSILPSAASLLRFWVNWSSALSFCWPSDELSSTPSGAFCDSDCWSLRTPWEIKLTTSSRVTPCWCR